MLHKFNVHKIISLLKTNVLVSKVDILLIDEIEKRAKVTALLLGEN